MEMPSFDISSEVDMVALKNAIDITGRQIANRYDFKGTSANVELNEKDKLITLYGDSDFQLDQIKDILLPGMEKKEPDSSKRLDHQDVQKVSGNKVKQELKIRAGIDTELAKKIVKMIKDSGRVNGAKRDMLQDAIAFVKKNITDFPLQFGNFRD
jgi:cyclic-di-GMP-binding protein